MSANDGPLRVVREPTKEAFRKVPYRLNLSFHSIAETKGLDTTVTNIRLSLRGGHLEGKFVRALEEEHFEVLDLGVGKHNYIVAKELLWIGRGHEHVESGV